MQIDVEASMARGAGVNPEDPPLRWEVSQADGQWAPATVLEDLTGGFNYGSGIGRARAAAALGRRPARRAPPALAALPDRGDERRPAAAARPTRTRPRSTRSAPPRWAPACPSTHAARVEREILGVSPTARRARTSRCATSRCSSSARARRSRSRTPSPATGRAGSAARTSSARPSSTATSCSTWSAARSSSARRSARPTAAGRSTARSRPRARSCASRATATAAAARAT